MFCPNCGTENASESAFCAKCGAQITAPQQPQPVKRGSSGLAIASLVLGILGGFGITAIFSLIFGIIALVQIGKSQKRLGGQGMAIAGICLSGFFLVAIFPAILFPVFAKARGAARKSSCQTNMKQLGTAVLMYVQDYDSAYPSSSMVQSGSQWSEDSFKKFNSRGTLPPNGMRPTSWPMALYAYVKNPNVMWCPSDTTGKAAATNESNVSYFWKAAIDYAWHNGAQKEGDYAFVSDQILMYEHNGWHSSDEGRGLTDGVRLNVLFMDSHVQFKTVRDSGYTESENPPSPLPQSGSGEPAWYNYNGQSNSFEKSKNWDPHKYFDNLP